MKFNKEQMSVIQDNSHFIQVIAGAGSGKTSTMIGILDRIIREKSIDPSLLLVVTFSRKAANEFLDRLNEIHPSHRIRIQTFHAYCLGVIKNHSPKYKDNPPMIITEQERSEFFREFFISYKFRVGGIPYKYLVGENESNFLPQFDPVLYDLALEEFKKYKEQHRKLEFSDLVTEFLEAMQNKEVWTEVPKSTTRYIIVDEFQDTDMQQLAFLQELNPERLIVVGDDWQAIYGFRGATVKPFLELGNYFSPLKRHYLSTNYRSVDPIVKISQIPIYKNENYISKNVHSIRKGSCNLEMIGLLEGKQGVELAANLIYDQLVKGAETMLLCRTNFRLAEFKMFGVPEKNLMTIHGSKGLEFETVFVDLLGGWSQNPKSIDLDSLEEERRILYVALSRAKDNLYILGRSKLNTKKNLEDEFFSYFRGNKFGKTRKLAA
ncbi:MAG: UvrD-helicase domain-containing protein [Leptospira sp.]|nr:UvrD-helicase domain-containing protein [Leptospira sp.]